MSGNGSWAFGDLSSDVEVRFSPAEGEIEIQYAMDSSVTYARRGNVPIVRQSPQRLPLIITPDWYVDTRAVAQELVDLLAGGGVLTLTSDMGDSWLVRVTGGVSVLVEDTPTRGTEPRVRVKPLGSIVAVG